MSKPTRSSLSLKRILISLLLLAVIPAIANGIDAFVGQQDISMMFALNICGSILIIYDWNLFGIHYNRSKSAPGTFFLYFVIGIALIAAWLFLGTAFLQSKILLPNAFSLIAYGYARPGMMIAFSIIEAAIVNIGFKCLTDHMNVRSLEIHAILISGLLFGLCFTALFTPLDLGLWFRTYLYNMVLVSMLSFLYYQSSSFMPGLLAMGVVYFASMIISMM